MYKRQIIRVVFKEPLEEAHETFYIRVAPGWWREYSINGIFEFTWQDMLQVIKYDEAEVFEVAYEGFGATEKALHHGGDFCEKCATEKGLNLGDEGAVV